MSAFVSPLQITAVAAAVIWPLAAGLGLVTWSKMRAAKHQRRVSTLNTQVRGLYQAMQHQPTPPRLKLVVDALQEHDSMAAAVARGRVRAKARA